MSPRTSAGNCTGLRGSGQASPLVRSVWSAPYIAGFSPWEATGYLLELGAGARLGFNSGLPAVISPPDCLANDIHCMWPEETATGQVFLWTQELSLI